MEPTIGLAYEWNGDSYTCTGMGTNTLTDIVIASEYDDGINGLGPVTIIANLAFGSNELTSVTIPNGVTNIGTRAFQYNQLTSVTIPNSVTYIGDLAFQVNPITSVAWETTAQITSRIFVGSNNKIASFTITSDTLISLANINAFGGVTNMTVYVQPQLIEDYKVATNWSVLYNNGRAIFEPIPNKSRKLGTLYANLESTYFSTLKAVKKETVEALVESDSLELNTLYVDNSESGSSSEIVYEDNFVDMASSDIYFDKTSSLSQGGGSETGRLKLARNMFELSAEMIYANPDWKYKYSFKSKDDGSIEIKVEDTESLSGKGTETYSFDFTIQDNPNQVTRKFEVDLAIQQAIEDVLLGEV